MLKVWTEDIPKPERGIIRRELLRTNRICTCLTRCLIRKDMARYRIWQKIHAKFYELNLSFNKEEC